MLRDEAMRDAKVRLQDHFVDAAAASALVQRYDADEVRTLFRHGPPVIRVLALGLMIGDPSLADAATIESAITESRTANEQYHGLRLAALVGRRLPPEDRRRLRRAIEREPIPAGHARTHLRASVLVMLADEPGADEPEADQGDDGGRPDDRSSLRPTRPRRSATGAPPTGRPGRAPIACRLPTSRAVPADQPVVRRDPDQAGPLEFPPRRGSLTGQLGDR